MKKLVHHNLGFQIDFSEGKATAIFFDNPVMFRQFVGELIHQYEGENGEFVLSENGEEISFAGNLSLITDILRFEVDDKKVLSKLQNLLKSFAVSEDMFSHTQEIVSKIEQYADEITSSFQYPIQYASIDVSSLIKLLCIIPEHDYKNELERLVEYMNIFHDICGIGCFIIIGAFMVFSVEEISMLVNDSIKHGHSMLFIEGNSISSLKPISSEIKKIVIDEDAVELYN